MDEDEAAAAAAEQQEQLSSTSGGPADPPPAAGRPAGAESRVSGSATPRSPHGGPAGDSCLDLFRTRKFFVLRPGTLTQAIRDVEALVNTEVDGSVHGIWLMAEVDHWNNEKERLVAITDNSLLIFKYDFILFRCEQIQRVQLNFVDRIAHGTFSFPKRSVLQRDGEGVRVFWDRLREPSFTSRWNPFATDFPFVTLIPHPVRNISDSFSSLCDIEKFCEQLKDAAGKAHAMKPVPGKANGVLILQQPIHIEAYVGAMSFLGNQNKLGYSMARGNIGF
ncbi:tumor protein p63-regulated gene 1 protein [Cololabis saira]|uniref:tumor protein p63-regulated gene 1 protein n=1 Tax=Cololabis saira TaxID=129043 RepID=UPI002AD2809C|nr:tumor protein p63-regulated gene 1 protein [Cololabis saira]